MAIIPPIPEPIQLGFDSPHLCECGCGKPTRVISVANTRHGYVIGEYYPTVYGHKRLSTDIVVRFWSKVDRSPTEDGCLQWVGQKTALGYGKLKYHGRTVFAHRISYELAYGEIREGYFVCHRCDNPSCVTPEHLFEGTAEDNAHDRDNKGRNTKGRPAHPKSIHIGEENPRHVATEAIVRQIREMRGSGYSLTQIANAVNLRRSTVCHILAGRVWKHVK